MVIRGTSEAVKWLNAFPPAGGLSAAYSPRAIILGRPLAYDTHCHTSFGSFVQAYTRQDPTNTPAERTTDAIFLRALDTIQGGYEVLNSKTGKSLYRYKVMEIPIPKHVITRVEQLAKRDGFIPHVEPIFRTYALLAGVEPQDIVSDDSDSDDAPDDDDQSRSVEVEVGVNELVEEGVLTNGVETDNENGNEVDEEYEEYEEDEQTTVSDNDEPDPDNEPIPTEPRRSQRLQKPKQILDLSDGGQVYQTTEVKKLFHGGD
jgi:hypothetical protein